jgi:hypothetical protein
LQVLFEHTGAIPFPHVTLHWPAGTSAQLTSHDSHTTVQLCVPLQLMVAPLPVVALHVLLFEQS